MSATTIARAAMDPELVKRVTALAHKEMIYNATLFNSQYGTQLRTGINSAIITQLMWPVAVDTETAYENAVLGGNGSPGYDENVISDDNITAAINAHWPPDPPPIATPALGKPA